MSGSCTSVDPSPVRPRTVCDLRSLPDLPELQKWAAEHGAAVAYLGPDMQGRAMYGASAGPLQRVAVEDGLDPRPGPVRWKPPTVRLPKAHLPRARRPY